MSIHGVRLRHILETYLRKDGEGSTCDIGLYAMRKPSPLSVISASYQQIIILSRTPVQVLRLA